MPSIIEQDCKCCQKHMRTGDRWHCEDCWNKYHHGGRDGDWLSRSEFEELNKKGMK